jgi:FkbM family methyltransferase
MTIVNIGANNGIDDCLAFCRENNDKISSIHLVEPNPIALAECRQSYSNFTNANFYQIAVMPLSENLEFLYIPESNQMSGHASTIEQHLLSHGHSRFSKIKVETISINNFFKENKILVCDRLYIDTEGHDCKIINEIDFNQTRVNRIEFEILHTDGVFCRGENYNLAVKKLNELGYKKTSAGQYNEAYQLC